MKHLISFDFDGTLARKCIQEYAKELMSRGYSICILTSRYELTSAYTNEDLYTIAHELSIDNIYFTNIDSLIEKLLPLGGSKFTY